MDDAPKADAPTSTMDFYKQRRFIPHPDAERFDAITIDTVERWKESELSGDEWRFSYTVKFWRHGEVAATTGGASIEDAALVAAYQYSHIKTEGPFMGDLSEVCCQPGCPNPWTVLLHPVHKYDKRGDKSARDYWEGEVRGFCERHRHRGDCGLDDNDDNYTLVEERFPPDWADDEPDISALAASIIHAVRSQGLTPNLIGPAARFTKIAYALLAAGWRPPS